MCKRKRNSAIHVGKRTDTAPAHSFRDFSTVQLLKLPEKHIHPSILCACPCSKAKKETGIVQCSFTFQKP